MKKAIKVLALVCISSILVGVSALQSSARIDPKIIAGMWLFDEGHGDIAKDSSGNDNDGKILGPEWVDDGMFGEALKFDGSNDYVDCGNCPSLDLTDQITFVVWAKHPRGTEGYVIIKNTQDDAIRQYGFLDYVSQNGIYFYCNTGAGREDNIGWPGETFDDDTWHHIAITVNNPDVELFVDGESRGVRKLGGDIVSADTSVWIGKRKPNNYPYTGILDELAVFSVALNEDDINRIMDDGLGKATIAVSHAGKLATAWAVVKNQR